MHAVRYGPEAPPPYEGGDSEGVSGAHDLSITPPSLPLAKGEELFRVIKPLTDKKRALTRPSKNA